ncbi:MAG: peptidoglycan DD-metalloendopeptidase family protein [Lewinella sp.]
MKSSHRKRRLRLPRVVLVSALCLLVCGAIVYSLVGLAPPPPAPQLSPTAFPLVAPTVKYGLALDTMEYRVDTILNGQTLSDILTLQGLGNQESFDASTRFNAMFNVRGLRAGRTYTVLDDPDTEGIDFLVYQPSMFNFVRLDLKGKELDLKADLPLTVETGFAAGVIESNVSEALDGTGHTVALTAGMESALQWSVDFYHMQPQDRFQLVYEKQKVGEDEAIGKVLAARYSTGGEDIYAFWYETPDSSYAGFLGLNGEPMKSTFLKSPVQFSRISSSYNLRRYHPILKRTRPHYGTDYAAPYGTPILSVADGVIIERGRRGGNGNFVKVRHTKQLTTQYLHMQKFAAGQKVGSRVKQGETIGYVGSTGLATGPHVCFRFWKDNKQIDHTKLKFPPAKKMDDEMLPGFFAQRDAFLAQLNELGEPAQDTEAQIIEGQRIQEALKKAKQEEAKK